MIAPEPGLKTPFILRSFPARIAEGGNSCRGSAGNNDLKNT
jgi:hypothetical protein